jgi:hypothetical protein
MFLRLPSFSHESLQHLLETMLDVHRLIFVYPIAEVFNLNAPTAILVRNTQQSFQILIREVWIQSFDDKEQFLFMDGPFSVSIPSLERRLDYVNITLVLGHEKLSEQVRA